MNFENVCVNKIFTNLEKFQNFKMFTNYKNCFQNIKIVQEFIYKSSQILKISYFKKMFIIFGKEK